MTPPGRPAPLRVRCLSGPNLQLLGTREPAIYGTTTLADVHRRLGALGDSLGAMVECRQSNSEGDLVTWAGEARVDGCDGLLLNPGALTHTSYALYDALRAAGLPAVEVHLSNPDAREPFRRRSRIIAACVGRVAGFGAASYELALVALVGHLRPGEAAIAAVIGPPATPVAKAGSRRPASDDPPAGGPRARGAQKKVGPSRKAGRKAGAPY